MPQNTSDASVPVESFIKPIQQQSERVVPFLSLFPSFQEQIGMLP